jgi:carboxypeptidase Taq
MRRSGLPRCAGSCPTWTRSIAPATCQPVFDWLRQHLDPGSRWTTDELLCQRASGEPLNPAHLRAHLESRYG